jgi:hypothetical protein
MILLSITWWGNIKPIPLLWTLTTILTTIKKGALNHYAMPGEVEPDLSWLLDTVKDLIY